MTTLLANYNQQTDSLLQSSSKKSRLSETVLLKQCSISQLLHKLQTVSDNRQIELNQHNKKMKFLHQQESEILSAIGSKMGL